MAQLVGNDPDFDPGIWRLCEKLERDRCVVCDRNRLGISMWKQTILIRIRKISGLADWLNLNLD